MLHAYCRVRSEHVLVACTGCCRLCPRFRSTLHPPPVCRFPVGSGSGSRISQPGDLISSISTSPVANPALLPFTGQVQAEDVLKFFQPIPEGHELQLPALPPGPQARL